MNTVYFIIQQTMFFAVPLLIVALGGMFSEKSGIVNIALEGIMIVGAFMGILFINSMTGYIKGQLLYILAMIVASLAGLFYSLMHAWASVRLKADQTISGTALNIFAPAVCIFTARFMFGAKQINFADEFFISKVPALGDIPFIGKCFFCNCYISTYIGVAILIICSFVIRKTRFGLRLSACGENPDAAASVGIPVNKLRYAGVMLSGILGGLGGVTLIVPTSTDFSSNVSGYGFLALAVLIMGQWKPYRIMLAAFFFGLLKALSSSYSGVSVLADLPIPAEIYKMIPYILTLTVLVICSGKSAAPKAEGIPYESGADNDKKIKGISMLSLSRIVLFLVIISLVAVSVVCDLNKFKKGNFVSNGYGGEIALAISDVCSIDDKSYTQGEWEGIVEYSEKNNITRKYYQAKDSSYESLKSTGKLAIKGNADVVVFSANEFESTNYDLQYEFPDTKFIIVDGLPHPEGRSEVRILKNTLSITFAEEESGFLAGYAAVKDGYRNLGFIGGMAVPAVVRFGYGFVEGAEYAASELGLKKGEVSVRYNYAGVFTATPEVLAMSSSWYRSGTEVIFACGGSLGNSVMKAAETTGNKVIGVDVDQSAESLSVITSAMKQVREALYSVLEDYRSGKISGGIQKCLTAKDNAVGLPLETSKFRQFTKEEYELIYKKLANDEIKLWVDTDAASAELLPLKYVSVSMIK